MKYAVQFVVEAAPRIPQPMILEFTDAGSGQVTLVVLTQRTTPDALGTPYPSGLDVDVVLDARTLDEALSNASIWADLVSVQMNLLSPGWAGDAEPVVAYALDGAVPRPITFFVDAWTPGARSPLLDEAAFTKITAEWHALPEEPMWRVAYAANSFRESLRAEGPSLRVPLRFSGLEYLNPLLDGRYPYTGDGGSKGLGGFIEATRGAAFEVRARRTRNKIVHGKVPIASLDADLTAIDAPLAEALRDAIFGELGVPPPPWAAPQGRGRALRGKLQLRASGEIRPNASGEVAPPSHRHPALRVDDWRLESSEIRADGTYHARAAPLISLGVAAGAEIVISHWQVESAPGVSIELTAPAPEPSGEEGSI